MEGNKASSIRFKCTFLKEDVKAYQDQVRAIDGFTKWY